MLVLAQCRRHRRNPHQRLDQPKTQVAGQNGASQGLADVTPEMNAYVSCGNINELVVAVDPYLAALAATGGVVGEFVNPKYADAGRTIASTPTIRRCIGPVWRMTPGRSMVVAT